MLGTGWSLGIWQLADGTLELGLPVSSGIFTGGFDFAVSQAVLDALVAMPRKALALDCVLHKRLQTRLMRGAVPVSDAEVYDLINAVVLVDAAGLDAFIETHRLAAMMARSGG